MFNHIKYILILLFLQYCNHPSDPINDFINYSTQTYYTGGYARDIDITDSTLAVASDQNGYFLYKIVTDPFGSIDTLIEILHNNDTNPYAGDDISESCSGKSE